MVSRRDQLVKGAFALALALQFHAPLPATDCNRNGLDDFGEVAAGTALDCNADGVPDDCDVLPVNYDLDGPRLFVGASGGPLALADYDGDARLDLAVAGNPSLRVLVGDGAGGFRPGVDVINARSSRFLRTGDLDGDRHLELVYDTDLGIGIAFNPLRLRGDAVGFVPVETEFEVRGLAVHDLDGDGDLDLAAAGGFKVALFLNGGGARFAIATTLVADSSPLTVAALDLDADGDVDLATVNSVTSDFPGNVSVYKRLDTGTFAVPRNFGVGRAPASLEVADLDGDGHPDLAVPATRDGTVSVLFNLGDGNLATALDLEVAHAPEGLLAVDLEVDGDLDLVAASPSERKLSLLFNHGAGAFGPSIARNLPLGVRHLEAADLDGDGLPEVVAGNSFLGEVLVLSHAASAYSSDCNRNGVPDECELEAGDCNRNSVPDDCDLASGASIDCNANAIPDECEPDCNLNGVADACDIAGGSDDCNQNGIPDECDTQAGILFGPPVNLEVEAISALAGDLDRDGDQDLVLTLVSAGAAVRLNRGDGSFTAGETVQGGQAHALGDLDGDGALDLGAAGSGGETVSVHLNRGDATFKEAGVYSGSRRLVFTGLGAGDFDADGDLDLAAIDAGGGVSVLLNGGAADFKAPALATTLASAPGGFLVRDLDADGRSDLATWPPLMLLFSQGNGFKAVDLALADPREVTAADLDRDGDLDLAASGVEGGDTAILFNRGQGAFAAAERLGCCGFPGPVTAGDLDLDGDSDLVLEGVVRGNLALLTLLQRRNGEFRSGPLLIAPGPSDRLLTVDLSGDAYPDLLSVNFDGRACPVCPASISRVLLNRTTPPAHPDGDHDGVPDACEGRLFHRGDANVDGNFNLSDAVFILRFLFLGAAPSSCAESADTNNDATIDVSDAIAILQYLFGGGPPPAAPGPTSEPCGLDVDPLGSAGDLGCEAYGPCVSPH
jgi:hypothetical protein